MFFSLFRHMQYLLKILCYFINVESGTFRELIYFNVTFLR